MSERFGTTFNQPVSWAPTVVVWTLWQPRVWVRAHYHVGELQLGFPISKYDGTGCLLWKLVVRSLRVLVERLCSAPGAQWVPSDPKLLFLIGLTEHLVWAAGLICRHPRAQERMRRWGNKYRCLTVKAKTQRKARFSSRITIPLMSDRESQRQSWLDETWLDSCRGVSLKLNSLPESSEEA